MQALFWISTVLLFYTYIGYGLLLLLVNAVFKRTFHINEAVLPTITFIVPAFNEQEIIGQKIANTLALDYPKEKLSLVFVTDGSTDKTPQIISANRQITLLHQSTREGKSAAINRAMQIVQSSVVIFSDANTMIHPQSLRKLVRHYADENVGGVSGEKRIAPTPASAVGSGERLYWQYESWLKKANSEFYTLVGAAGELFSLRTKLFQPLGKAVVLDDFVLSATVCLQGHRFLYEPEAYGTEQASETVDEERKRKMRISAGCYQALFALPRLLNLFQNLRLSFQYFSHRVLRWVVCPLALPVAFFSNLFLCLHGGSAFYTACFAGQCLFYLLALTGAFLPETKPAAKAFLLPFYFLFMVLSQYAGFYRFVRRRQPARWEKARRGPAAKA